MSVSIMRMVIIDCRRKGEGGRCIPGISAIICSYDFSNLIFFFTTGVAVSAGVVVGTVVIALVDATGRIAAVVSTNS